MATKFVRVKDPDTGHEVSVTETFATAFKMTPLDKPAVDANGRPLPGKPKTELPKADAGKAGN